MCTTAFPLGKWHIESAKAEVDFQNQYFDYQKPESLEEKRKKIFLEVKKIPTTDRVYFSLLPAELMDILEQYYVKNQ